MSLVPGQTLSFYEILGPLGAGGMGEVYRARDERLEREVAIKVLPDPYAEDEQRLRRFEREAKSLASLNHPNVAQIYGVDRVDDTHFLVLELVPGETLEDRLARGAFSVRETLDVGCQIVAGLEAAHEAGVIHRDLKPANVRRTPDGKVKVLDFGLAKLTREGQSKVSAADSGALVTAEQTIIGTAPYMSPEQIEGGEVDARSDLFCLGTVLYELTTGERPFQGKTAPAVMSAVLRHTPPPIRKLRKDVPAELDRIIARCLQKEPALRYQTARELQRDLQTLRDGAAAAGAWHPASWSRANLVAAASVLAVLAGFVLWRSLFTGGEAAAALGIVVLPFDNGGAPEDAWFAAAMTHGVAERLGSVDGLIVRRPPNYWKGKSPEEIHAALGGDYLLDASVFLVEQGAERRALVTPELSRASDGALLPLPSCERTLRDNDEILDVQRTIANQVVERLGARRDASASTTAGTAPTKNTEAYSLYLKGRYFYGKRDEASLQKSLECFERAVQLDPDFTLALVGIASIPGARSWYSLEAPTASNDETMRAIERALAVDPELPEALTYLATAHQWNLDFEEAERAWKKAIEFGRKHRGGWPSAHQWYSYTLAWTGRREEALEQVMIAWRLDPVSPIITTWVGLTHYYFGDYDEAISWMDKALELDPDFVPAHWHRTWASGVAGEHDEAIAHAERARSLSSNNPIYTVNLAWALAGAGRGAEARELLAQVTEVARTRYVSNYHLAAVHVALGEHDAAFRHLDEAFEDKAEWRAALKVDQRFLPLRDDPRFADLLRRMGL